MLLKNGSIGFDVGIIQNNLNMLGYDSIFGKKTENAVKKFQKFYNLSVDGIVTDQTWSKLIGEIKYIQIDLRNHGYNLIVDGIAGPNTYNCLIEFQELNNIAADGIVGPTTRQFLCPSVNYDISPKGINFIADYESFSDKPNCRLNSKHQTIGYGHIIMIDEKFSTITSDEAKVLLKKDLESFVHLVNTMVVGLILSQNQFDALVSFAYSCGVTALNNSTLLKNIKHDAPIEKIQKDFLMWSDCNGERASGLYRRRLAEFEMYSNADYTRTYSNF
jgi:peptidoglycan hydrolase-like protein with peptidoglycan-binding domain